MTQTSLARLLSALLAPALLLAASGCIPEKRTEPPSPFSEETFTVGQRYFMKRDYPNAAQRFSDYLLAPLSPANEGKGRYWLGRSLLMMGRANDAARQFDKALDQPLANDLVGLALLARGDALTATGRHANAEADYRRVIRRGSPSDPVALAMARLAQALTRQGKDAEARAVVADLKLRFPNGQGPTAPPPTGAYSIQIGAYSVRSTADRRAAAANAAGFAARIERIAGKYHIRVGPYASITQAKAAQERLKTAGFPSFIVKN